MTSIEDFIYQFEGSQREVMLHFYKLLTTGCNLLGKMRYRIPFFYGKSWICYLNPLKNGMIEFAFVRGNELSNHQGILDSKGRKQVYSIEFGKLSDIPLQQLREIIHEAILLDETTAYESKRKVKGFKK
jgi:hypothetical protein